MVFIYGIAVVKRRSVTRHDHNASNKEVFRSFQKVKHQSTTRHDLEKGGSTALIRRFKVILYQK